MAKAYIFYNPLAGNGAAFDTVMKLKETIKAYGKYEVEIKILADISAKFIVSVHQ